MRFSEIERTCKRIIQLRNVKIVSKGEPIIWCQLLDALMDHMEWPIDQWEPNPNNPNGLKDRFDRGHPELRGHFVIYTDAEKKHKTELQFWVIANEGKWKVAIGDTIMDLPSESLASDAGKDFLAKASKTITDAVFDTARRMDLP